jgi:hypothetical protein
MKVFVNERAKIFMIHTNLRYKDELAKTILAESFDPTLKMMNLTNGMSGI